MRWKAHQLLNQTKTPAEESYGFKSRNLPLQVNDLISFQNGMTDLFQNIKFKDTKCSFQSKLNNDFKNKVKKLDSLLIPADKTTNVYAMNTTSYDKLITENETKTYKEANDEIVEALHVQSARITNPNSYTIMH